MELETEPLAPETPGIDAAVMGMAPETINLLSSITDEKERKKIADRVFKSYDRDWRSSERYREKRASILKLFIGMLPPSQDDGAQVHYSIIATAVIRIHARIYDQQFPSNGEFFGVRPTDQTDLSRAVRIAKHLNWQILHKIKEYVPNHDVAIMQWLLYGSAFTYTYWSPTKNRPCHEVCATEDIVLPYKRKSTDPSLADVPRITRILRPQRHEIEEDAAAGYYDAENVEKLFEKIEDGSGGSQKSDDSSTSGSPQEVTDRAAGVEDPDEPDSDAPRVLLEQHRWLKLPGEKKSRPVIVTMDKETKILLSIRLREDEDQDDRARYNREQQASEAQYAAAMMQYQMDMAQYEAGMTQMPMQGEMTATVPPMMGETTSTGPMMQPPVPPEPPAPPAPVRMVPVHFFTHYSCLPNPEGVYGYGIGFLLEGNNMVADTIASQMVDAGTLANGNTFIYSRQAKLSRGEFRLRVGEGNQTDLSPQDLDKGIKFLPFPGANPGLGNFIKDQKEDAVELSGANEILSGEVGGSNETATTTQIRISQALAAISILNKRYTRARTVEGEKLARLNSVYLEDKEYFPVVDPTKKLPPEQPGGPMLQEVSDTEIGRMDYLQDVDITVTADPRMASQPQRFQEAEKLFNMVQASPFLASNPFMQAAVSRLIFQAADQPELIAAMSMMPPMPMGPGGPMPGPEQEPGKPKPEDPGPAVPNAGPTPANMSETQGGPVS